jgi:hypothetical protein
LGLESIRNYQNANRYKKQSPAKHKTLIFCLLKLNIAAKIAAFILVQVPQPC